MCVYVDGSQCQRQSRWRIFSYAPLRDAVSTVSDCKQLSVCVCVLLKAGVYTLKGPRRVSRSDPKGDKVSASDQECWQGSYRAPSAPLSCWIIDGLSQHSPHTHTYTPILTHTHTHYFGGGFLKKFKYRSETHWRHSSTGRRFNKINTKQRHSETVQLRLRLILFTPPSLFLSSAGFWNHRAAGQ